MNKNNSRTNTAAMKKIVNNKEYFMKTFHLDDKQIDLILHWFENEPSLDKSDNTPVLVIKDENKPTTKDNIEWLSIRIADSIKYARQGGLNK